jgi:hypothetical protein
MRATRDCMLFGMDRMLTDSVSKRRKIQSGLAIANVHQTANTRTRVTRTQKASCRAQSLAEFF